MHSKKRLGIFHLKFVNCACDLSQKKKKEPLVTYIWFVKIIKSFQWKQIKFFHILSSEQTENKWNTNLCWTKHCQELK